MKRHLPRVLSSFRSSKRRIPPIDTNKTLSNTPSPETHPKPQRSRSAEAIKRKLEVVPLAEDEVVDETPNTSSFVKKREPVHLWDFNKRFSTNYASFRARKSPQVSQNCRAFELVILESHLLLKIYFYNIIFIYFQRHIEVLHDFQNAIGLENSPKTNHCSSKKLLSFENDENSTTIASRLRSSSLTESTEIDVLHKDSMSVSVTTNKIDYILEELVCFCFLNDFKNIFFRFPQKNHMYGNWNL